MNYRHAFHAGGIADVFKHLVLIALVRQMTRKPTPFFLLDTHAGTGLYDLDGAEASRTGEWRDGIGRIAGVTAVSPLLRDYLAIVAAINEGGAFRLYPGSPRFAAELLRVDDRATLCELHDEDAVLLRRTMRRFASFAVHRRDGYEAIGAFVPPPEKRGLIFVDPPFEATDEFARAIAAIEGGYRKFPQGLWALWYPVKERAAIWRFHEATVATGLPNQLAIEFVTTDESDPFVLNGSGVLLVNPPWTLEDTLRPALEELRTLLAPQGRVAFLRLAGEAG